MNFISNVLDSIPVVGHVKAGVHLAAGDKEGAKKALYQSTRTSAVLAGGAAGCLVGGPAGAVAAGMYAGLATDGVASAVMDEPQGIVKSCKDVADDITSGQNPVRSIASTGFQVAMDGVGGFGMGGMSSIANNLSGKALETATKELGKEASQEVVKQAIKQAAISAEVALVTTHVVKNASQRTDEEKRAEEEYERQRANERYREQCQREERERKSREEQQRRQREENQRKERENRANQEKQSSNQSSTNSGSSQAPQGNRNNDKKSLEETLEEFEEFLELLQRILKIIYSNGTEPISRIFKGLSDKQKEYLIKVISALKDNGCDLEKVLELVIKIFKDHMPNNISFTNFLSLLEFVEVHLTDQLTERGMIARGTSRAQPRLPYKERRRRQLLEIANEPDIVQQIVDKFNELRKEIEAELSGSDRSIFPDFRDIFAAVYHYFKHKRVPGDGVLSVKQYFDWIRQLLAELKKTPEYDKLKKSSRSGECVYEVYVVLFGRRFKIVVKNFRGNLVLSSAFVVRIKIDTDKDGTVSIKLTFS